jgi:hypothetical protein
LFKRNTVFVIGAGASVELGLPTGEQLKRLISSQLRFRFEFGRIKEGDDEFLEMLKRATTNHEDLNRFLRASAQLADTVDTFASIDEALHWWRGSPDIVLVGKLAIAHYILKAERASSLINKETAEPILPSPKDVWLPNFLSIAVGALAREQANEAFHNVTMINFNYDRSIEHFLYHALQRDVAVPTDQAKAAVSALKMVRPYGTLGPLDWQADGGDHVGIRYGGRGYHGEIATIAEGIRTYTEQWDSAIPHQINTAISQAELIIFLGFGFHQQNLTLLGRGDFGRAMFTGKMLATVCGIPASNFEALQRAITTTVHSNVPPQLIDCRAVQMVTDLRLTIGLAAG